MPARVPDVLTLLNFYGVGDERLRQTMEQMSRDVWQKGWWDGYAGQVPGALMDFTWLEDRAHSIRWFEALVIPGLLQTADYARSLIRAAEPEAPVEQIARWVEFRVARQQVLDRDEPLRLVAVVAEGVLRQVVGGPEVMRSQLRHLVEMAKRPNVEVRVLPFSAGAHASPNGCFEVVEMPDPYPNVAHIQSPAGAIYVEEPEVERFARRYDRIYETSLGPDDSASLVRTALAELE